MTRCVIATALVLQVTVVAAAAAAAARGGSGIAKPWTAGWQHAGGSYGVLDKRTTPSKTRSLLLFGGDDNKNNKGDDKPGSGQGPPGSNNVRDGFAAKVAEKAYEANLNHANGATAKFGHGGGGFSGGSESGSDDPASGSVTVPPGNWRITFDRDGQPVYTRIP